MAIGSPVFWQIIRRSMKRVVFRPILVYAFYTSFRDVLNHNIGLLLLTQCLLVVGAECEG